MWTTNRRNLKSFLHILYAVLQLFSVVVSQQQPCESADPLCECELPEEWIGQWNQAHNDGSISVTNISTRGIDNHGICVYMIKRPDDKNSVTVVNKFIIDGVPSYKYMLIDSVHENVIKYKESLEYYDDEDSALSALGQNGMNDVYQNIYRNRTIPCPFNNNSTSSYSFTYSKAGGRECSTPVSYLRTCTTDSKRVLDFQACPDVAGTESILEQLTCIGSWTELDGSEFLFGQLANKNYHEVNYRCLNLIRNKDKEVVKVAFPEDSSCYQFSDESSMAFHRQVLNLRNIPRRQSTFANRTNWLGNLSSKSNWISLNNSTHLSFNMDANALNMYENSGELLYSILEFVEDHEESEDLVRFSATKVVECDRKPICVHIYKRSSVVIEMEMYEGDYCNMLGLYSVSKIVFIDSADEDKSGVPCPFPGKYSVTKAKRNGNLTWKCSSQSFNTLIIGCTSSSPKQGHSNCVGGKEANIEFYSTCTDSIEPVTQFECLASWEDNDRTYVILIQDINHSFRSSNSDNDNNNDNSINSNSNDVTTSPAKYQCLEIDNVAGGITIESNRNSCRKSYKEDSTNEWEVNAVLLIDSSADHQLGSSAKASPSIPTPEYIVLIIRIFTILLVIAH